MTRAEIEELASTSDKRRFTMSADGQMIRAAQGHSVDVDLQLTASTPPETLFHGTATTSKVAILEDGLSPRGRQHVYLSLDKATARKVGQRHGVPIVFSVASGRMHRDDLSFWQADNGVWLTERVAPGHLSLLPR